jgi:hypothetical protein
MSTKEEIEAEKVRLARERILLKKAENRAAFLKAGLGIATTVAGTALMYYLGKEKYKMQNLRTAREVEGTAFNREQLAYKKTKMELDAELAKAEVERLEAAAVREKEREERREARENRRDTRAESEAAQRKFNEEMRQHREEMREAREAAREQREATRHKMDILKTAAKVGGAAAIPASIQFAPSMFNKYMEAEIQADLDRDKLKRGAAGARTHANFVHAMNSVLPERMQRQMPTNRNLNDPYYQTVGAATNAVGTGLIPGVITAALAYRKIFGR